MTSDSCAIDGYFGWRQNHRVVHYAACDGIEEAVGSSFEHFFLVGAFFCEFLKRRSDNRGWSCQKVDLIEKKRFSLAARVYHEKLIRLKIDFKTKMRTATAIITATTTTTSNLCFLWDEQDAVYLRVASDFFQYVYRIREHLLVVGAAILGDCATKHLDATEERDINHLGWQNQRNSRKTSAKEARKHVAWIVSYVTVTTNSKQLPEVIVNLANPADELLRLKLTVAEVFHFQSSHFWSDEMLCVCTCGGGKALKFVEKKRKKPQSVKYTRCKILIKSMQK